MATEAQEAAEGIVESTLRKLTDDQRAAIVASHRESALEYRLPLRHRGNRGLISLGITYSTAEGQRAPGVMGLLTALGRTVRERLGAEAV